MLQLAKPQKCHSKVSLDAVVNIIWLKKTTIRVVRAFLPYCRYSSTPPPPPLISQTLIYCIIIPTISSCIHQHIWWWPSIDETQAAGVAWGLGSRGGEAESKWTGSWRRRKRGGQWARKEGKGMREGYYTLCGGIYVTSQLYKEHGCNDKKKIILWRPEQVHIRLGLMLESSWVNLICLASDPYNNDKYAQQLKQRMGKKMAHL